MDLDHVRMKAAEYEYEEVGNQDNVGLDPCQPVIEVFGRYAREIPDFVPTRWELLRLAQYWAEEAISVSLDNVRFQSGDCCTDNLMVFAKRRVQRIARIVGEEDVMLAIADVYDDFDRRLEGPDRDQFRQKIVGGENGTRPWILVPPPDPSEWLRKLGL